MTYKIYLEMLRKDKELSDREKRKRDVQAEITECVEKNKKLDRLINSYKQVKYYIFFLILIIFVVWGKDISIHLLA